MCIRDRLKPLGKKVFAIVNYDNFSIVPELVREYMELVGYLVEHHYVGVTRYTTSAFLRARLGDALREHDLTPHIYETAAEAAARLNPAQGI